MVTKAENMEMMLSMAQQQVNLLKDQLDIFLGEYVTMQNLISEFTDKNETCAIFTSNTFVDRAFDKYMAVIGGILNLANKFHSFLLINRLNETLSAHSAEEAVKAFAFGNIPNCKSLSMLSVKDVGYKHRLTYLKQSQQDVENGTSENDIFPYNKHFGTQSLPTLSPPHTPTKLSILNSIPFSQMSVRSKIIPLDLDKFVEGFKFEAAITYIEDYDRRIFYVCESYDNELLELSTKFDLCRIKSPSWNEIFGVSINGQNILRAILSTSFCNNNNCSQAGQRKDCALLIDIGEIIPIKDSYTFFYLPPLYKNIPKQIIKCTLMGIDDSRGENNEDSSSLKEILKAHFNKTISLKVLRNVGGLLFVNLCSGKTEEEFGDCLKDRKELKISLLQVKNNESIENYGKCLSAQNSSSTLVRTRLKSSDSLSNIVSEESENKCSEENMKEIEMLRKSLSASNLTDNNRQTNCSYSAIIEKIQSEKATDESNEILNITVTHIVDITSFYAQVQKGAGLPQISWMDKELTTEQKNLQPPNIDDIVLAQYLIDKLWYRAKILEIDNEKNLYKVFFVDFGNVEMVPLSCLATSTSAQLSIPRLAVNFQLAGVRELTTNDETRHMKAIQMLRVTMLNQSFSVEIVQREAEVLKIRFVEKDCEDMFQTLLKLGYIEPI